MTAVLAQSSGPDTWDWDFAREIVPDLLDGLWLLIRITLSGVALALVGGLVLAILRRSRLRAVRWPVTLLIEFVRGTPLLIQLFFLYIVLPVQWDIRLSAYTVGVLALGLHYAAYTSETYRAGIDSVPRGQWEAATAINLSAREKWKSVILPQAVPTVLPPLGNYVIAAFKDAPLVSVLGLRELLGQAQRIQGQTFRGIEAFTLAGLLFLAISIPAAIGVRLLEKRYAYERT